jgi:hypothetical protein
MNNDLLRLSAKAFAIGAGVMAAGALDERQVLTADCTETQNGCTYHMPGAPESTCFAPYSNVCMPDSQEGTALKTCKYYEPGEYWYWDQIGTNCQMS